MNISIQINTDGKLYWWDDEEHDWLHDDYGHMIEATTCLCFARSDRDCVCGAWDIPLENDYE